MSFCIFEKDWGVTGYYNAMVYSVEEMDDGGTDAFKVGVFVSDCNGTFISFELDFTERGMILFM